MQSRSFWSVLGAGILRTHRAPGRVRRLWALGLALLLGAGGPTAALTPAEATEFSEKCKKWAKEEPTAQSLKKCYYIDVVVANQGDLPDLGKGEFDRLLINQGKMRFDVENLPPGPRGIRLITDPVTGEVIVIYKKGSPTTSAAVALADVDGDGDLDVFVANHGFIDSDDYTIRAGESNVLLINKGNGTFTARALDPPGEWTNSTAVAAGDLNDDGYIDFLVGNDSNPVQAYINDGKGNFTITNVTASFVGEDHLGNPVVYAAIGGLTLEPLRSLHIALGDLNNDGWLDALVAYDGEPNHVLINNKNGTFTASFILNPPFVPETDPDHEQLNHPDTESVVIADFNGDGHLDGLFANDGEGVELVINDGNGNFTRSGVPGTEGSSSKAIVAGDFNNDGHMDAVVINTSRATGPEEIEWPLLLLGNGDGTFRVQILEATGLTMRRNMTLGGRETRGESAVAADFDGDGDLDVMIGNVTVRGVDSPERNYILRNDGVDADGNVIFKAISVAGGPRVTDGLAAGDVNGNGYWPAVVNRLPNINLDGLLPSMYPTIPPP